MTEHIKKRIEELFESTPDDVRVSYGFKKVGGQYTDEKSIIFSTPNKLPLSEIPENEVFPSSVEINGVTYSTDVVQRGVSVPMVCNNSDTNPCFQYGYPPDANALLTPNSQLQRPLLGGSAIRTYPGGGTLGFIAKHTATGKLVGVTNGHVVYDTEYNYRSIEFNPEVQIPNVPMGYDIYQPYPNILPDNTIGKFLYVKQTKRTPFYNQVDAALISLVQNDPLNRPVITNQSWKQVGLDIGTTPPPFATTEELDNLLNYPNLEVSSSGLATGPKQGTCGLRVSEINTTVFLSTRARFNNCIMLTRIDPTCKYAINSGDSGSGVFAKINGVWKIIGLAFAGPVEGAEADVCRIDYIASALGIEAWDGTVTSSSFVNPASIQTIITAGVTTEESLTVNGKTYRQGIVSIDAPTV